MNQVSSSIHESMKNSFIALERGTGARGLRSVIENVMEGVLCSTLRRLLGTWELGTSALVAFLTVILAVVSGVILIRFSISPIWLVVGTILRMP